MLTADDNFYRPLDPILEEVNIHCIKMEKENKTKYRNIANVVVQEVIKLLRGGDPVFNIIYSRLDYVGSYYDGLRVKEATEFDLNVIVKLPLLYKKIKVENTNSVSGFVKMNIAEAKDYVKYVDPCKKVIDKWCDEAGYLKQNTVRHWLESVLQKNVGNERIINIGHNSYRVQLRKSGPAFTLMIYACGEPRIDVDLVLTLEFGPDNQPPRPIRLPDLAEPWIVVPKTLEGQRNKDLLWRISFPSSEKKLLEGLHKMKLINRFLKALRDAQKMNIASYYIKTEFLWEGHKVFYNEMDRKFWEKNKGVLFVYGLSRMQEYLEQKKLPYYWHKGSNLFASLPADNAANMANRFKYIIKTINKYLTANDRTELRKFIFSIYRIDSENIIPINTIEELDGGNNVQEKSFCLVS